MIKIKTTLFYKVLAETTGLIINDEQELMDSIKELAQMKKGIYKGQGRA